ncbi:hypothetical protein L873DRAFT_1826699 [Choiromyces venosus 120613-1]|uniref:C2H2-type domain-containing protein n=1 Tax=Choiromyces venosus 120613-1 TaxID=1336337 RepID=A0A3N4JVP7_9PEZI|nr:hypothetical protein L873DRAFT_1826699 [Choiromyces venosus 120613-1]
MALRPTRPSWLFEEHQLEAFIEQNNPTISLSTLRASRNDCKLVDSVLKQILSEQKIQTTPGEFEMYWAKTHLALDLQSILKRWCGIGWDRTWEGSALRNLCPEVPKQQEDRNMDDAATTIATITPTATAVEQKIRLPKSESTSPRFSSTNNFVARRQNSYSGWTPCNGPEIQSLEAENAAAAVVSPRVYPIPVQPTTKRPFEDSEDYQIRRVSKSKSVNFGDRTQFICPYHAQNTNEHPDCANKSFPNPRKLKEHVWRWLKPFKCPTCGEGFGREKTRAIHCDQRKTKCKKMPSTYEGSAEQRRDQKIESAKSTKEMIEIFEEYEREKHIPRDSNSSPSSINSHNQDKNSNNDDDSASDEHHHQQAGEYRDTQDDRSSSPESQNASNASVSDGDSDHGDNNYTTTKSNHTFTQRQQVSSAMMSKEVDMQIDVRRNSTNNKEQEQADEEEDEDEDEVGLGLNPRHGFDHLNSNNAQQSLSQDSFQYHALPQASREEDDDESRTLYLYPHHHQQISPILRTSPSAMDFTTTTTNPNTSNNNTATTPILSPVGTIPTNILLNVPEIVVTDAEPQLKSPTIISTRSSDANPYAQQQTVYYPNPTSSCPSSPSSPHGLYHQNHQHHLHHHDPQNFRGEDDEEDGSQNAENPPYVMNSRGMGGQAFASAPFISAGYGSIPSMAFRINFG